MHPALRANYEGYQRTEIPTGPFFIALGRDKKNTDAKLGLILPDVNASVARGFYPNDEQFQAVCADYLANGRVK
jgi:hypothetical protein